MITVRITHEERKAVVESLKLALSKIMPITSSGALTLQQRIHKQDIITAIDKFERY